MTHYLCTGWVQVGSAWALRMLHFRVRQKLVRCSSVCHGLEIHLYILSLILDLLWRELYFDFPFFIGLLLSRAGPCLIVGFSIFSPFFAPSIILLSFLPYHFAIPAVVLFDLCLLCLFWAYCKFLSQLLTMTQYGHWIYTHATLGFFDLLHCLWASLAHFFLLGHPWPISFLRHPRPISNSAFLWAFTNSFGFPWPNYLIFHPWGSWASYQPRTFLIL